MKKLFLLCFSLLSLCSFGQKYKTYAAGPRVLTFADMEYGRLQLKVKSGSYKLTAYTPDSVFTMEYGVDDVHPLYTFRGDLRLNRAGCDSSLFTTNDTIEMRARRGKNWTPSRPYLGQVTIRPNLIYLETIVQVSVEPYIAGVVEAEGGLSAELEYHKAQAVLARTWLITNMGKHKKEGYHIKDDQSSQAFKGVPHGKHAAIISAAVAQTKETKATYSGNRLLVSTTVTVGDRRCSRKLCGLRNCPIAGPFLILSARRRANTGGLRIFLWPIGIPTSLRRQRNTTGVPI